LDRSGGVESIAASTLHRSDEKNLPRICIDISTSIYFSPLLMTSMRHFSFSFPEEMDGLIDFLFLGKMSPFHPRRNFIIFLGVLI